MVNENPAGVAGPNYGRQRRSRAGDALQFGGRERPETAGTWNLVGPSLNVVRRHQGHEQAKNTSRRATRNAGEC